MGEQRFASSFRATSGYSIAVVVHAMNLLLLEPDELGPDNVASVDGVRARHLRQVLRAEPGRPVRVGLIDGPMGTGTVLSIDDGHARLACAFDAVAPPVPVVDLLLALPRPKVLQRLWAQLAALGVGRIVLTNAARVERNYFDTTVLDPAVYRPLLIEGLQQARDTRVPVVTVHRQFRILVEDHLDQLCPQPTRLLADPGEAAEAAGRHKAGPYETLATGRHEAGRHAPAVGAGLMPARMPSVSTRHPPAVGAGLVPALMPSRSTRIHRP
jgi:16S rRNA U1498 N3-methylase RsmE